MNHSLLIILSFVLSMQSSISNVCIACRARVHTLHTFTFVCKMASSKPLHDIDDITYCCICTELYNSPKVLPCLHTFCLECLEKYSADRCPGDEDTCPLCRQQYIIPPDGIAELPPNFFIQKLVDIKKLATVNIQLKCDLCVEGSETVAKLICVNCGENMCNVCGNAHKKSRSSRTHQMIEVGGEQTENLLQGRPSFCDKHPDKQIEFFCDDCRQVTCVNCCLVEHARLSHNTHDINEVAETFRQQLQSDVAMVTKQFEKCQQEAEKCLDEKIKFSERNAHTYKSIFEKKTEILHIIDTDINILVSKLNDLNVKSIKENEINKEEIGKQMLMFETFTRYCQEVVDKATSSDISRLADELHARARELQNMTLINALPLHQIKFSPSDVVQALNEEKVNIVGAICTELDYKPGLHICLLLYINIYLTSSYDLTCYMHLDNF